MFICWGTFLKNAKDSQVALISQFHRPAKYVIPYPKAMFVLFLRNLSALAVSFALSYVREHLLICQLKFNLGVWGELNPFFCNSRICLSYLFGWVSHNRTRGLRTTNCQAIKSFYTNLLNLFILFLMLYYYYTTTILLLIL